MYLSSLLLSINPPNQWHCSSCDITTALLPRWLEASQGGLVPSVHVHDGPWQKILATLPANSYDLIFYDPLNISPRPDSVTGESFG